MAGIGDTAFYQTPYLDNQDNLVNPTPGGSSIGDLFQMALSDPAGIAKKLGAAGIAPPTGIQAPGALPGPHFASGVGGLAVPMPNPISGAQTGAGRIADLQLAASQRPMPTLGSLITGGTFKG
jgi:hypothetical protein